MGYDVIVTGSDEVLLIHKDSSGVYKPVAVILADPTAGIFDTLQERVDRAMELRDVLNAA